MELTRKAQHQRQRMFGDSALVDALRAREPHAGRCEARLVVLVDAGADRLDEAQARRVAEKIVAPEPGDDKNICVDDAR